MSNIIEKIKNKIINEIHVDHLEIVDNSHKHKGHKFFTKDKFHIHVKIKSSQLNSIPRIEAHKKIMKILSKELKKEIHAIEISIEK